MIFHLYTSNYVLNYTPDQRNNQPHSQNNIQRGKPIAKDQQNDLRLENQRSRTEKEQDNGEYADRRRVPEYCFQKSVHVVFPLILCGLIKLAVVQLRVEAALLEQRFMTALLDNIAVLEYKNKVGVFDG